MRRSEAWHWIVTVLAVIGMFYHASRSSEIERAHKALLERVMDGELESLELHAQVLALKVAKREPEPRVKIWPCSLGTTTLTCEARNWGTSTSWLISP